MAARSVVFVATEIGLAWTFIAGRSELIDRLVTDPRLESVCSDWQIRRVGGAFVTNDHRDHAYDVGLIDRLARIDDSVQPVLAVLTGALPRFAPYRDRFGRALARVDAGEHRYFTDDMESYHTIWFQLHEDLLATLGRERFSAG